MKTSTMNGFYSKMLILVRYYFKCQTCFAMQARPFLVEIHALLPKFIDQYTFLHWHLLKIKSFFLVNFSTGYYSCQHKKV